jgi:hypothetical protein
MIKRISTTNAVIVLIAATIAVTSIPSSLLSTSYQVLAQSNVTQEATSSANQTEEEIQSGIANMTQEGKSPGQSVQNQANSGNNALEQQ